MWASDRDYSLVESELIYAPASIFDIHCVTPHPRSHHLSGCPDSQFSILHPNRHSREFQRRGTETGTCLVDQLQRVHVEEKPNGNVDHCKSLALTDYHKSNQTLSYWEMEVTHLREEFWIIQGSGRRQRRVGSGEEDEPISSKLR
jgi:hypothetical protein